MTWGSRGLMPALSNATSGAVVDACGPAGRQAAAGEPPLGLLVATGLLAAAGAWAPHVVETMSFPALGAAGYTRLLQTDGISFKETVCQEDS